MKASELRIGNLTNKGVIKNMLEGGIHIGDGRCFMYNNIKPVQLTEGYLLDFGFEKINHIHGYSFYSLSKSKVNKCHIDIRGNSTTYMGYFVNNCEYVHQLQNLFFALTGNELVI